MKKRSFLFTLAALLLLIVSSCGTTCKMGTKKQLSAHVWELNTLNGKVLDINEFRTGTPFLIFDKSGFVSGSTGCNNFTGKYELNKTSLSIEAGAMTRMACQGNGETLFLNALKQVKTIQTSKNKITLLNGMEELMTLVPKK